MAQNAKSVSTWVAVPVVLVGVVGLLTVFVIEGRLSPQTFARIWLVVIALAFIVLTVLLKRSNRLTEVPDGATSSSPRNVSKKKAIQVALLLLWLVAAFWITRGGPWIPRLIGAAMLVLFFTATVLRKPSQAEIRPPIQLPNDPRERHRAVGLDRVRRICFIDSPIS